MMVRALMSSSHVPRLSLSWYSQATPGQGVVGEEQVNCFLSFQVLLHLSTPSKTLLMTIIPIMLSTPGRTGDQIMQEATLIDQKYEDDAKSQNFLFVQNIQLLFPSLPRREARKLMMGTPHRRRIIFLLDSRSQLFVLSCTF